MAKQEFKWDTEEEIGVVVETVDKVEWDIGLASLNGVQYITTSKRVMTKEGWAVKKRQNFKRSVFMDIEEVLAQL